MEAQPNLAVSHSQHNPFNLTFDFPVRLSEKYRPHRISEFVGLDRPKRIASKFVARPYACSFIFDGPPGVGKTSLAQAMAEEMNAEFHHIGSQKCTLEELERVCRICAYVTMEGKGFHFVLIDEVDSASRAAQLALLSKLDSTEAPKQTVWVFTCNTTENLEPRFISRCIQVEFSSYGMSSETAAHLQNIWQAETGSTENAPDFLRICKNVRNNVRDALQALESELLAA
jgi:replication-associated recombination protein RarA